MNINVNDYKGSDSDRIQAAIEAAGKCGGMVRIPTRRPDAVSPRDYWLLDRAIILPSDTTLMLENCRVKLSDRCRDNFIRSANCGEGIATIEPIRNIHIIGIGNAVLEGADHPRATGDAAKILGVQTYGTDSGVEGEKQTSDWRSIGVLLAYVTDFSIQGLTLKDTHSWGVSLEHCTQGQVTDLAFDAHDGREINGTFETFLNQDGLDLRQGCHDITIQNITGTSGDDLIALTAIRLDVPAGILDSSMVSGMTPLGRQDDVHDIIIRNVRGTSVGGHHIVRFLNASGVKMYNILLDGVIHTSPETVHAVVRIGDSNPTWGGVTPLGDTHSFVLQNIIGHGRAIVLISGSLCDSLISNVIVQTPGLEPVTFASGPENIRNVTVANTLNTSNLHKF